MRGRRRRRRGTLLTFGGIRQRMLRRPLAVHLFVILAAMLLLPFDHFVQAAAAPPHVLMVLMENTSYEQIVGNPQMPFVNAQAPPNGSLTTTPLRPPTLPTYLR